MMKEENNKEGVPLDIAKGTPFFLKDRFNILIYLHF